MTKYEFSIADIILMCIVIIIFTFFIIYKSQDFLLPSDTKICHNETNYMAIQILQIDNNENTCNIRYSYSTLQYPSISPLGTNVNSAIIKCPKNINYSITKIGDMEIKYFENVSIISNKQVCEDALK